MCGSMALNESLITYRGLVNTWECDQMGHMNVQFYVDKHAAALAHLAAAIGITPAVQRQRNVRFTARRDHIRFRRELHAGALVTIQSRVLDASEETVRVFSELVDGESGDISATIDCLAELESIGDGSRQPFDADSLRLAENLRRDGEAEASAYGAIAPDPDDEPDDEPAGMFETYRGAVDTWECGPFGMMAPRYYTARFSDAAGHVYDRLGLRASFMREHRWGSAALDYKTGYFAPLHAGDIVIVKTGFLALGNKTLTFHHRLINGSTGELAAAIEIVSVLFDLEKRKAFPVPDDIRRRVEPLLIR